MNGAFRMVELSLVIPVYNEQDSIQTTLQQIHEAFQKDENKIAYEIIVVNDGSTDGSGEILQKCSNIHLINNDLNRGYGASLKIGIRSAKGKVIAITDADGTYPNDRIPEFYHQMQENSFEMLVAARTGKNVKIPLIRRPPKFVLNMLANYLTNRQIPDLNSGLRLFYREPAIKYFPIISDGFSFTTTITLAMLANDYNVHYEPIEYASRKGQSKIRPIRDTFNFLILILRTIAFFNPLKIFIPISLIILIAAIACLVYQTIKGNIGDISVLLMLSSLQVFCIGMIADLITRKS